MIGCPLASVTTPFSDHPDFSALPPVTGVMSQVKYHVKRCRASKFDGAHSASGFRLSSGCDAFGTKSCPSLAVSIDFDSV